VRAQCGHLLPRDRRRLAQRRNQHHAPAIWGARSGGRHAHSRKASGNALGARARAALLHSRAQLIKRPYAMLCLCRAPALRRGACWADARPAARTCNEIHIRKVLTRTPPVPVTTSGRDAPMRHSAAGGSIAQRTARRRPLARPSCVPPATTRTLHASVI
jgi:hypothetical protein